MNNLNDKLRDKTAVLGVIGLGYVGLPVACIFAEAGFTVIGVDIDRERVDAINRGENPIQGDEPGLSDLLAATVAGGRLRATTDYAALAEADVVTINVETPVDESDQRPRYAALGAATRSLGAVLKEGALVIVESTVAPGTMDGLVAPALEETTGRLRNQGFYLGHCPERVMPGKLLYNIRHLSRVCGGSTPETAQALIALYGHVVGGDLDAADCLTAELVKTMENAYRDVQIGFANEMALLCRALGADVWRVRELVNKSPSRNMHLPGAGVGGHCIPKDGWLLIANAPDDFQSRMIPAARAVNEAMPGHMADLTRDALAAAGVALRGARIAVLGYAYLENSDDTRHTPTAPLLRALKAAGATVIIHDPFVAAYQGPWPDAVRGADAVIFMVRHDLYAGIAPDALVPLLRTPVVVDGRRIFEPAALTAAGLVWRTVGVGQARQPK